MASSGSTATRRSERRLGNAEHTSGVCSSALICSSAGRVVEPATLAGIDRGRRAVSRQELHLHRLRRCAAEGFPAARAPARAEVVSVLRGYARPLRRRERYTGLPMRPGAPVRYRQSRVPRSPIRASGGIDCEDELRCSARPTASAYRRRGEKRAMRRRRSDRTTVITRRFVLRAVSPRKRAGWQSRPRRDRRRECHRSYRRPSPGRPWALYGRAPCARR